MNTTPLQRADINKNIGTYNLTMVLLRENDGFVSID